MITKRVNVNVKEMGEGKDRAEEGRIRKGLKKEQP